MQHHHRVFNNFGTCCSTILYDGRVIGNWRKTAQKGQVVVETSFFDPKYPMDKELMENTKVCVKGL